MFADQKRIWSNVGNLIEVTMNKSGLNGKIISDVKQASASQVSLCGKFKKTWNTYAQCTFRSIENVTTNPKLLACRIYRKIQPYISQGQAEKS